MCAGSTFEDILENRTIPAFVDSVVVSGLNRTDERLIKKQFRSLVQSQNLEDLFNNVVEAKRRLNKLGVFRHVYSVVDAADEPNKYKASELFIIFQVEEKRPVTARLSATHGTDGTSKMCGAVRLNNLLRGAEYCDLDLEIGTNKLTSKCATLSKPLENNPYVRFSVGGTEGRWDHWWAKFLRQERSAFAEVQAETPIGLHKLQWDAVWREVEAKDNSTPWSVRKESGSMLKVGVRHTFERDSRPDLVFPDSGFLCRFTKELASINPGNLTGTSKNITAEEGKNGLSADKSFQLKLEAVTQKPFRLTDWLVGELTFSTGMVHSLTGHPVHIADRYFLGGPLELRGFQWRSVCPLEPLLQPGQMDLPLADPASTLDSPFQRLSNCIPASASMSSLCTQLSTELGGKPRMVIGAGLVVRFAGVLRIEVNYCIPVKSQSGDLLTSGFTFGFGMYYA
ncbi:outer membrane protein insertion porin family [Paragonimus westermani]|uniref:Outer membrane protein insertion porin family n=1 Tax=Paragonimus westermani TaxID=34504 RepID=A0A5J4P1J7_9TREM|nr:outer membrane protein insertion porin family [Paragonimus westermani]